ncbi:integral membrane protein [Apiospora hydei]|uniref:Integral membrane protein n=1 Tax=Apiospora hydei TaxID=1337664 RepID=A0ABR1V7R1_9PEZI
MDPSENRGPQLMAVVIVFLITATTANTMRCYTRIGVVKAFGVDDWTMLIAYFWWFCYIWYGLTMMFSKISIGVFILRVTANRYHTWTVWAITVLTAVGCGIFILVTMFQCAPVDAFWEDPQGAGRISCIDGRVMRDLAYAYSAVTLFIDLTLVVLPLWIVWKLKMSLRTKIGLSALICSGLVASVGPAVRFAYLDKFTQPDFLFDTSDVAIWSAVEIGLSVTAGSLATLKPLFRLMYQKLSSRTACATKGSYAVAALPSPTSPTAALDKYSPTSAVLRPSSSLSPKRSPLDSLLTSAAPSLRNQDRGFHRGRPSITGEMLEYHEVPARPTSIAPTLPRLSSGTWRFSREDMDDLEKGITHNSWVDIYRPR